MQTIRTAKNLQTITPSMTLAITAKSKQLRAEGKDVIGFGAGEPDFDTPEPIKQAGIDAINANFTRYTEVNGTMALRKLICKKLKDENGLDYEPKNIIVNSGAKHSLYLALCAILNPGDEVIVPVPYWVSYPEMVKIAGGVPVYVATTAENGFKLSKEDLNKAITQKTKVIMLNSPSNPTGSVYTKEELQVVAKFAVDNNLFVISDEIYESIIYGDTKHISIAQLGQDIKKNTILINGLSKTYAMTGWRIGYTAAEEDIIKAMSSIQGHTVSHPASIAQKAAEAAFSLDRAVINKMVQEYDARRQYMMNYIDEEICDLSYIMPQGAFYLYVDISKTFGRTYNNVKITCALDFASALLENYLVAVIPGEGFGTKEFIRLSYATSLENIKEGLKRIKDFLNQ
jgi:aspartate aminotransferase